APSRNLRKVVWNRALLLVEIGATLGLIVLVVSLLQSVQSISETTANIQAQYQATANAKLVAPTATPVISVSSVVLPVGHTVNVNQGVVVSVAFNLDEVPAQYRDQYQALISEPIIPPTVSPEGPTRIRIPAIK